MEEQEEEIIRVRKPRDREVIGVVESRLGGTRMKVVCADGNSRVCRIPGRLKRRLWVREGGLVLVEPWEIQGNEKGDVIFNYSKAHQQWLQREGLLKGLEKFLK